MCYFHWVHVPTEIQVRVKTHFHRDQCKGLRRPTREWLKAAREAITSVQHLGTDKEINRQCDEEGINKVMAERKRPLLDGIKGGRR